MKALISITTMAVLCGPPVPATVSYADGTTNLAPQIEQMMKQFESNKEPGSLLKVIAATDRQKSSDVEEMIASRIALLKRVAAYYDATYDRNPPPPVQSHVMPPMGYDTGIPPELVTDPKLRDDYARRIAENRINSQRHETQTAIRSLMSKVVDLYFEAEHGNLKNVEMRVQRQEMPQGIISAMKVVARESEKRQAARNGFSQSTATNEPTGSKEKGGGP